MSYLLLFFFEEIGRGYLSLFFLFKEDLFTEGETFFTPFLTGLGLGLLPGILTTVLVVLLAVRLTGFDELLEVLFTGTDFLDDWLLVVLCEGVLTIVFDFAFNGFFLTEELDVLLLIIEELLGFELTRAGRLAIFFIDDLFGAFFLFLTTGFLVCTCEISFLEGGFLARNFPTVRETFNFCFFDFQVSSLILESA